MTGSILTALSMENHHHHHLHRHSSTLLSMDPAGPPRIPLSTHDDGEREPSVIHPQIALSGPPDINLPLLVDQSSPRQLWDSDPTDLLDVGLAPQVCEPDAILNLPKSSSASGACATSGARKCGKKGGSIWGAWFFFNYYFKPAVAEKSKCKLLRDANGVALFDKSDLRLCEPDAILNLPKSSSASGACATSGARKCGKKGGSIWGAWFFFNYYFKPAVAEKSKCKLLRDANGVALFDKSDLRLDVFLVQHDMENMYMWAFKEQPENALGKMQLRSYMNGHSRQGEPQFPFSVDKGFVRSHRMQRKQYRGLSNPQCVHGIQVVRSPNLSVITEADCKKWMELSGRDLNFSISPEASDFELWRNLTSTDFELESPKPSLKCCASLPNSRKLLSGWGLNLLTSPPNHASVDSMDLSPVCSKRRKGFFSNGLNDNYSMPANLSSDRIQDMKFHPTASSWVNDFTGVMRQACGPVTAAKTIYEDEEGYLIVVSLPFSDRHRVKVSWRNNLLHGIVKISCVSTARMPYIKRHDRKFKLTDPSPEHCPPGEYVREIPLATRIPEDAKMEAYYDESGTILEIMVPKRSAGPEEHEVQVCMRRPPHLGIANELMLT